MPVVDPADYLAYFGLTADPFAPGLEPFYAGGPRRELFPKLLHLCQFSADIVVVVGEEGVGKSALKSALLNHLHRRDRVCDLTVPLLSAREQIIRAVARQLGVAASGKAESTDGLLAHLRDFGADAGEREALKIIVIDDAHHLDDDSLQCLLELVAPSEDPHCQFHLVLFGEPQLRSRLSDGVHLLRLDPLSTADLRAYLRFRMDEAGFKGLFPFTDQDIEFLWKISHGRPGAAHDAAREILVELALPPPEPRSLGLPATHMVLIIGLLSVLLIALFYRGGAGVEEMPASSDAGAAPIIATDSANMQPQTADPVADSTPEAAAEPEPGRVLNEPPAGGAIAVAETVGVKPPETPPSATLTQNPVASPAVTEAAAETAELALTADEKSLLDMTPDDFTLQVLAAASRESVEAFVARQPNRRDLAVFTAVRDGKTLHIIVAGRYPDSQAARDAVSSLPSEQREAGPWPRTLRSVQADIRELRHL